MKRLKPAGQPPFGSSEYFDLVAAAERCVRRALDREPLPPVHPEAVADWLHCVSESLRNSIARGGSGREIQRQK